VRRFDPESSASYRESVNGLNRQDEKLARQSGVVGGGSKRFFSLDFDTSD
jgi:hypothetical protein